MVGDRVGEVFIAIRVVVLLSVGSAPRADRGRGILWSCRANVLDIWMLRHINLVPFMSGLEHVVRKSWIGRESKFHKTSQTLTDTMSKESRRRARATGLGFALGGAKVRIAQRERRQNWFGCAKQGKLSCQSQ